MHNNKHKKSNKIPDNMEDAFNSGQNAVNRANDIDFSAPKKSKLSWNIGFGW